MSLRALLNVYKQLHEYDRAALKQLEANNDIRKHVNEVMN